MKYLTIAITTIVIALVAAGQVQKPPATERQKHTQPANADPASVTPENVLFADLQLFESGASHPEFSHVEDLIVYERRENVNGANLSAVWISDVKGAKRQRVVQGARPSWSPDGKRIAFTRGTAVYLFDRAKAKEFLLHDFGLLDRPGEPGWTMDGKNVVLGHRLLNLDTLGLSYAPDFNNPPAHGRWRRENVASVVHPNCVFALTTGGDIGVWVTPPDGSFHRRVLFGYWKQLSLSRDLARVALSGTGAAGEGVYIARLTAGAPVQRHFMVSIGVSRLRESFSGGCLKNGDVYADIYSPKVNPLNDKVVGPDRRKGTARFVRASTDTSIIYVLSQHADIRAGDVVGTPRTGSSSNILACQGSAGWAILEPVSAEAVSEMAPLQRDRRDD